MDNSFRLCIVLYSSSDCCVISYTTLCKGLFLHPSIVEISEVVLFCNTVQFLVQPEQVLFNYSITRSSSYNVKCEKLSVNLPVVQDSWHCTLKHLLVSWNWYGSYVLMFLPILFSISQWAASWPGTPHRLYAWGTHWNSLWQCPLMGKQIEERTL